MLRGKTRYPISAQKRQISLSSALTISNHIINSTHVFQSAAFQETLVYPQNSEYLHISYSASPYNFSPVKNQINVLRESLNHMI